MEDLEPEEDQDASDIDNEFDEEYDDTEIMLALSESGKEAIIELGENGSFVFTDVDTGISCNLTYNESDFNTLNITGDCDLDWTETSFAEFSDNGEPLGITGPGGEIYLL
jgi:hypothetical protein